MSHQMKKQIKINNNTAAATDKKTATETGTTKADNKIKTGEPVIHKVKTDVRKKNKK